MAFNEPDTITPREYTYLETEKEENRLNREYQIRLKELEIQLEMTKSTGELELKRLEAKWSSWLSIPKYIIKLPVLFLFGIGYIIHAVTKKQPLPKFWDFINK